MTTTKSYSCRIVQDYNSEDILRGGCGFNRRLYASYDGEFEGSSSSSSSSASWDDNLRQLKQLKERRIHDDIMKAIFLSANNSNDDRTQSSSSSSLIPISLVGQARLPLAVPGTTSSSTVSMLVLTVENPAEDTTKPSSTTSSSQNALLLPLTDPGPQLRLLSFAYAGRPVSSLTLLLSLNTLLINREGTLFDNLPWAKWSKDPQKRNRDAAGNPIDPKFHLGKRDAFQRFMGKDWPGRSLALGNLALRLKYMTESIPASSSESKEKSRRRNDDDATQNDSDLLTDNMVEESQGTLTKRILQLRIRELQMEVAAIDAELAVARNNPEEYTGQEITELEATKEVFGQSIQEAESDLNLLLNNREETSSSMNKMNGQTESMVDRIAQWSTTGVDGTNNEAPYRGAMGYAPMLDSRQDIDENFLPTSYRSPYDLLKEILYDQLNAKVIGCALENTSLLRGNLVLGGAIVLQRVIPTKTTELAGENLEYNDYDEDYGNQDAKGGEIMVIECDVDEAIGVAMAYGLSLQVEQSIFERAAMVTEKGSDSTTTKMNMKDILPLWVVKDSAIAVQVEGDADTAERTSPVSIPRTTSSFFDTIFEPKPSDGNGSSSGKSLFPTDNPIKSLDQLDRLANEDKAKVLLEMSNFSGRLPRPRVVQNAPPNENPLDKLLLPLVDESVRNQYRIREAEQRGDTALANELRASKSNLQKAKEQAEAARMTGDEELSEKWEDEAKILESLRADVTQDEGSYSRFLDRDDWYERDRQRTAKRTKKSSFGNLLDGIE